MEYYRQPNNKIQAGFALHVGNLLKQYGALTANLDPKATYDATLTICALQSLLTTCIELLNAMKENQKAIFASEIPDLPRLWGIKRSFITRNTFPQPLTYERLLKHLRNSLSHPTSPERGDFPSTGYSTVPDQSGIISLIRFVDSPWIDCGRTHSKASSSTKAKVVKTVETFERQWGNANLEVRCNPTSKKYEVYHGQEIFLPVFEAEFSLSALRDLATGLSNHLAQPTVETWDGSTIHRLVA